MQIEAGKFYRLRNGEKWGPAASHNDPKHPLFRWWGPGIIPLRTDDGKVWTADCPSNYDLVAEWVESVPAAADYRPSLAHPETDVYAAVAREAVAEVRRAKDLWPNNANSAHEQYAVLLEEVDELWAHVKTNQKRRDLAAMRKEAIQVAAMAIRFAAECCDETTGRK